MILPHWYLVAIGWFVLACGFVTAICAAVVAVWLCIEWSLTYFSLHRAFIYFLSEWIKQRQERLEREAETGPSK